MKNNVKTILKISLKIICFYFVFLLAYKEWIFSHSILTNGDWVYFFKESMSNARIDYFSTWITEYIMGGVTIDLGQAPFYVAYGLLAKYANLNYEIVERVVHLWPIVIFTPLSSYLLLNKFFKNKIAIYIGVLVYTFNTYFLLLSAGILTLRAAFAFLPAVLYFFILTLEKRKIIFGLITSLILFIISSYEPRAFYIALWLLFLYFIYYLFFSGISRSLKSILNASFFAALPIFLTLLMNFYWIFSLIKTGSLTQNAVFDRSLFGNEFMNISQALTLFHPFWTGARLAIFNVQQIPFYFWFIPVFAFLGLFLNRKNYFIIFFGMLSLLGIFLTKQVDFPFSGVYDWLFLHLPGFNAFREASKFYVLIALGYSVLIAGFVDWLWMNWKDKRWKKYSRYLLTIIIAFIFLWNIKPLLTGELGTLFVPREVPLDYIYVKNLVLNQKDYFRTLWVPVSSRWSIYTNNHPKISMIGLLESTWLKFIKDNGVSVDQSKEMITFLKEPYSANLISRGSFKYIIVPLRDVKNDDDFFKDYGNSREIYINVLNKLSYLKKIDIGTKEVAIYENFNYRPHAYLTKKLETINTNEIHQVVDIKFINPAEYKINLINIKSLVYLNFSESYHPDWKLRAGEFNWVDVLTKNNYFIPDKYHLQNDAALNTFYLDPVAICKEFACVKNKNGSYDISMTLYFATQSYLYLGLIISGGTLIVVLCFLSFSFSKYLYKKYK